MDGLGQRASCCHNTFRRTPTPPYSPHTRTLPVILDVYTILTDSQLHRARRLPPNTAQLGRRRTCSRRRELRGRQGREEGQGWRRREGCRGEREETEGRKPRRGEVEEGEC